MKDNIFISDEDVALSKLNQEYKEVINSKEYRLGVSILNAYKTIRYLDLRKLQSYWRRLRLKRKQSKLNNVNIPYLTRNFSFDKNKKVVVYTCVTGEYERPVEPLYKPSNVDYFVITDMEIDSNSKWKKIDINSIKELSSLNNIEKSRFPKILPHRIFQDYDYSIYVDANVRIISDIRKSISSLGKIPFASHWHPERNSIYQEAKACILAKKGNPKLITEQMVRYRKLGMPDNFGLIECNILVREHNSESCKKLMELWWEEFINSKSYRDQLSLPFVIWHLGYTMKDIGFIESDVKNNISIQLLEHCSG
ncbi:DUF616 domain-containing protein [Streptococcus gallolyticus subsp. gallolyticus]|uniref:glycosyltransferase domain-containing protein n=1 Tax=Streptococcus gallolyticus TaxID=315405 RepID=UPI0022835470|nr:glycosyltransferase domain-containing protein [Streptococcus gallolyticus]MCY7152798.1 DUF616 domain-containing protein [Streptococcus gallolyticus subsp. gallolyticus]